MKKNKSPSFFGLVKDLVQTYIQRINDIRQLARLEARLAGKSLINMIIFIVVLGFLLGSTWLSFLLIIFLALVTYAHLHVLIAATILLFLNLIALILVYYYMNKAKENLFFPATRRQISNFRAIGKDRS